MGLSPTVVVMPMPGDRLSTWPSGSSSGSLPPCSSSQAPRKTLPAPPLCKALLVYLPFPVPPLVGASAALPFYVPLGRAGAYTAQHSWAICIVHQTTAETVPRAALTPAEALYRGFMKEVSRELTLNYKHISTGQVRGSKRAF